MLDNTRFFFVLTAVGTAIGIGSRWAFPYYSYQFGAWFFLAYFAALILLGLPLLVMEFSAGQFFKKNVVDTFFSIKEYTGFFGWIIIFNAFLLLTIYAVRMAWHIIYIFVSFGQQWQQRAESYFFNNVLQVSGSADFSSFSLAMFIALAFAWVAIYPIVRKGFESLGKYFTIIMTVGSFLMVFFLVYSLSLDGALTGIYSMFHSNIDVLLKPQLWVGAFSLVAVSIGVSFGIMHAISQKADGFIVRSASIAVLFEFLTSIVFAFIFFGMMGFLARSKNVGISTLAFSDYFMTFTKFAEVFPLLSKPTLLSISFFAFLLMIFLLGASALCYSIVNVLSRKLATKDRNVAILVCGFGFLFGIAFVVRPGYYVMDIVNHYTIYNILIVLLLEAITFGWIAKSEKIASYVNETSFFKLGNVFRLMIRYFVPIILAIVLVYQIKADWFGFKMYPWWTILLFGIGTIVVPLLGAFLMPQRILDKKG